MRRFLLITFLTLTVLLIVTAGFGLYLVNDEEFLKSRLGSIALKYTGRELVIDGPLELSLGRETSLEANDIHFANAAWADEPDMVTIGHLKISVELSSLFSDRPVFPVFVLEECRVSLVKNDAGDANWDVLPDSEPGTEPVPEKPKREHLPLWLKELKIQNCQVDMQGPHLEKPLDIKVTDLSMLHGDDHRWTGRGSGSVNDKVLSFDGWFAPFGALFLGGPLEHDLMFRLGGITLESSGSVKDAATWTGANLTAQLHGPEITDILNEFMLPHFSEGAFDFTLRLNTEGDMTKLDLDGDLGSLDARAEGELDRLIRPTKGSVHVKVDGPNLGALAKIFGLEGLVEDAFNHEAHASVEGDAIHFKQATLKTDQDQLDIGGHFNTVPGFAGTELDIHIETSEAGRWANALGRTEHALGPLSLDGKLSADAQGLFSIRSKVAQGATTLAVEGTIGHLPDALQPDLKITFNSADPSPLATITGWKNIPAAPLAIQGQVGFKNRRLDLGDVRIDLAGNKADIDGHVNFVKRYAGSEIKVGFDIENVEKLGLLFGKDGFPNQPMQLSAMVKPEGKGLEFQVNDGNLGEIELDIEGKIADLEHLQGLDAKFNIKLPRLDDISFLIPDKDLPAAPFTAKGHFGIKDRKVQLDEVSIDLAGNKADINGRFNLENRYAGSEVDVAVDIKNAGELGLLFGKEGLPDQPVKLTAVLKPEEKGLGFQINDGNLGHMQLDLEGKIADLEKPHQVDATFDIKLPRLSDVSFLIPGRELPDLPFAASGRLVNEQTRTRLDEIHMELGKITASIDGELLPEDHFQLSVKAAGPDASKLDRLVRTSLPAKPFSVASKLGGSLSQFELSGLSASLGRSQASADLKIELGDIRKFKGKIASPHLDLSHWYTGEGAKKEKATPAGKREWMFDDRPLKRLADHRLDVDLDLRVDELNLGNTSIEDIALGFILSHQLMELRHFTYKGTQGGRITGEFSLDEREGKPKLNFILNGKDVRLGLAALPEQDPSTYPPIDLEVALDGMGDTRREVASSFNGYYRVYLGSGLMASAGLDLLFSDFLTQLFSTLNPFAETSKYTQLDCAVMAAEIDSGMVKSFPNIYHTKQLTILSDGTIDLNTEKVDLSFNTKPRTGLGLSAGALINPLIKVGGRLTSPAVEMDPAETIKSGGLAVATLGISVLAKSMSDRFLSSPDPCGDARKEIEKRDSTAN
jgi:uncharacterized protein involved in outer membrane biogenesis